MAERTPKYLLVLVMFALAAGITYYVRSKPVNVLFDADFRSFPMTLGAWKGEDIELSGEVRGFINADSILSRSYTSTETGDQMTMLVIYRKYGRRDFVHRPESCYPADGWELVRQGYTVLPYGGKNVRSRFVVAEKDGEREVIAYWFASGRRTEANYARQQLLMAFDRLKTRKYGWAFIRLNSPVITSDEDTLDQMRKFLRAASSPLAKTLYENSIPRTPVASPAGLRR